MNSIVYAMLDQLPAGGTHKMADDLCNSPHINVECLWKVISLFSVDSKKNQKVFTQLVAGNLSEKSSTSLLRSPRLVDLALEVQTRFKCKLNK
jgi:hypothetical protein